MCFKEKHVQSSINSDEFYAEIIEMENEPPAFLYQEVEIDSAEMQEILENDEEFKNDLLVAEAIILEKYGSLENATILLKETQSEDLSTEDHDSSEEEEDDRELEKIVLNYVLKYRNTSHTNK